MSSLGLEIELPATTVESVNNVIKSQIEANHILLFIKGTPVFPQCGFSARVVQIMDLVGVPYKTIDVLKDRNIREQIKEYSKWPTIPQIYIDNEFIGGCDILTEMYQRGEIQKKLVK